MARNPTVNITFTGDSRDAQKAVKDVDQTLGGFGNRLTSIGDIAKGVFTATAVTSGISALSGFLKDSTTAAIEDEAGMRQLAETLRNSTGATDDQIASVEKFIHAQQTATGVLDDNLRPAFANVLRATKDVTKAQDLLRISQDISASTGRDLESVSLAVAKAYEGNVGGLSRLGISMKDAKGDALSWDEAQAQLNETFGGAAQTAAQTTAGKFAILKARFADFQEQVGGKVIPIVLGLAGFMTSTLVPAVKQVADWIQDRLTPPLTVLAAWVRTDLLPALQEFGHWLLDVAVPAVVGLAQEIAGDFQPRIEAVVGFIEEHVIPALQQFAHWIGDEVAPKLVALSHFLDEHRDYVYAAAAGIALAIVPAFIAWAVAAGAAAVATIAATAPVIAIGLALASLGVGIYYVREHWDQITAALGRFWDYCNNNIVPVLKLVGEVLLAMATGGLSLIWTRWDELGRILGWVGDQFNWVHDVIDGVSSGIQWLVDRVFDLINLIGQIHWPSPPGWLTDIGGGIVHGLQTVGGIIPHAAGGIFTTPHIGLIAESGPEAIIPLGRGARGLGLGDTYNITVSSFDPAAAGRLVEAAVLKIKRGNGGRFAA